MLSCAISYVCSRLCYNMLYYAILYHYYIIPYKTLLHKGSFYLDGRWDPKLRRGACGSGQRSGARREKRARAHQSLCGAAFGGGAEKQSAGNSVDESASCLGP